MTTTTRTTRKAPWAAVLTALLAVLALVFGAMVMAAPATAKNDPDKTPPGQSENFVPPGQDEGFVPPGQENTPPGQNPGDTPGSSHDKLTICHKVEGLGETGAGWNIITMNEQAWAAHQAHHASMDFVVTANTPCPPATTPVTPMSVCSAVPGAVASSYTEIVYGPTTGYQTTEAVTAAYTAAIAAGQRAWTGNQADCTTVTPPPPTDARCPANAALHAGELIPAGVTADAYCTVGSSIIEVTPEQAAAVDAAMAATAPEAVAPVQAATVADEPETVAVPAPATVPLPATVPAGDGSSVPQAPVALLALLALATAAAVTSGLRMATNR